jgi:hypothetical protein
MNMRVYGVSRQNWSDMKRKTYRIVIATALMVMLLLTWPCIGCSGNGTDGEGNGSGQMNGDSAIVGEIIGILTYETTYDYMPPNNTPVPRTTLQSYDAAIEDEDGNILQLFAPDLSSDFQYDGMSLSRVTSTVAGYVYTDDAPFNDESRVVGGKSRVISHTGILVSVTGSVSAVTGYISGDAIEVVTIEETG